LFSTIAILAELAAIVRPRFLTGAGSTVDFR
jgi:hypothetical protein